MFVDWLYFMNLELKFGWERRLKIVLGVVRGLEYFYEYVMLKMYYGDVKFVNILLDYEWEFYVLDFGLLIWSNDDKDLYLIVSCIGGIFGYLDLEFVLSG